jgi:hypothetical protein
VLDLSNVRCSDLLTCILDIKIGIPFTESRTFKILFQWFLPAVVKIYFQDRGDLPPELKYHGWLLDLSFVTNLTAKMNNLNTELQGNYWHH